MSSQTPDPWPADVHFGGAEEEPEATAYPEPDPDDEELHPSPADVIAILGFDPLDLED